MYNYKCQNCEHKFEFTVDRLNPDEENRCPLCDSLDVERQLHGVGYMGDTGSASVRPRGVFKRDKK